MKRFIDRTTERVDLGGGDWVELRTRLSYGDREAVRAKLLGFRIVDEAVRLDAEDPLRLKDANIEVLVRAIAAWGGPGFCAREHPHEEACVPVAIAADQVERLDPDTADVLLGHVRRLARGTPDFTKPPTPSTEGTAEAAVPTSPAASPSSNSSNGSAGPSMS